MCRSSIWARILIEDDLWFENKSLTTEKRINEYRLTCRTELLETEVAMECATMCYDTFRTRMLHWILFSCLNYSLVHDIFIIIAVSQNCVIHTCVWGHLKFTLLPLLVHFYIQQYQFCIKHKVVKQFICNITWKFIGLILRSLK